MLWFQYKDLDYEYFTNNNYTYDSKSRIAVIGPFNTGTNLMKNVIEENNTINNNYHIEYNFWKHTFTYENMDKNSKYIIMARHPYLWISSLKKESYNIKFNSIDQDVKFIRDNKNKFEQFDLSFNNLAEIWNMYYRFYKDLLENNKLDIVTTIDYCKLVDNTNDNNYEYVLSKLKDIGIEDLNKQNFIDTFKKPAKDHGHPVSVDKAIYKCDNMDELLTDEEKEIIDKTIDKSLLTYFNL
jgi:hypothetical protein